MGRYTHVLGTAMGPAGRAGQAGRRAGRAGWRAGRAGGLDGRVWRAGKRDPIETSKLIYMTVRVWRREYKMLQTKTFCDPIGSLTVSWANRNIQEAH